MKIKKGDKVKILLGKDRGKTGTVDRVLAKTGKVLIIGLNIFKKHLKPRGEGQPGEIIDRSQPLAASKVALICPKCGKITRQRICRSCKAEF